MKIFAAVLLVFVFSSAVVAQTAPDTIYYNKDWKKTYSAYYTYYRTINRADGKFNVEDHYRSGQIQMRGSFLALEPKEVEDGHFTYYTESGIKTRDEYFKEGLLEGDYLSYDTAGHLMLKMFFKHDKWDGHRTAYYSSGVIYRDEIYADGEFVSGHVYNEKGKEVKFFPREEMPVYPGGDAAMAEFVSTHLEYPDVAKKLGIQGTVKVKFVVGTEGKVEDVGIAESENIVLNDAAMDVVRKLQKFKPAQQEGRLVKFSYILPIVFKIK